MQRPHASVFENNPAFADLYPRLEAQILRSTSRESDEQQRLQLEQLTRSWHKLKIMWAELQLILHDDRYKVLSSSLSHHISQARFKEHYGKDLEALQIPASHTFIQPPTNITEQLGILSDVLAASLDEKLLIFRQLQALSEHDEDLVAEKKFREAQMKEYRETNAALRGQLSENVAELYKSASVILHDQADYLEKVKHGSAEKFSTTYLDYYEEVSKSLLEKSQRTLNGLISSTYTPELRRSLEKRAREIKHDLPQTQERLRQVNEEIAERENTKTPEYVSAIAEYQRLKSQISQAEQDIDKLKHYRSG